MTIKRAREMLGKRAEKLSDKQILDILAMLGRICDKAIDEVLLKT